MKILLGVVIICTISAVLILGIHIKQANKNLGIREVERFNLIFFIEELKDRFENHSHIGMYGKVK